MKAHELEARVLHRLRSSLRMRKGGARERSSVSQPPSLSVCFGLNWTPVQCQEQSARHECDMAGPGQGEWHDVGALGTVATLGVQI